MRPYENPPSVTVVVPTYNRPERLRESIQALMSQTFSDYTIIVVDDGSDDPEQEGVLSLIESEYDCVNVIRQENSGPSAARNTGWRAAKSDIILFTDDDCLPPESWISDLATAFENDIAAVGGPFVPAERHYNRSLSAKYHRWQAEETYRPIEQARTQRNPLPHGITANIGYRRTVLSEVDGFDESFPIAGGEDADLIKRVAERDYSFKYVPTPVLHNDLYTLKTFLNRSYNRGKGLHYLHERHGPERNLQRVLLGLCATPFFFPKAIVEQRGLKMAAVATLDRAVNRLGELSAIFSER